MLDPEYSKSLSADIILRINENANKQWNDGHRRHLGGSLIGDKCARRLWYQFRWFLKPFAIEHPEEVGRKMRLFNRGHREEPVFIDHLKAIGFTFEQLPDEQLRVSDCENHFGGSLDNTGYAPPHYNLPDRCMFEFKTCGDKYYKELKKDGLRKAQPTHWSQICVYGYKAEIKYCFYFSVNKNTDELYVELVEVDMEMGAILINKAQHVINSQVPLPKFAQTPTNFVCKFCNFINVCHFGAAAEINCRSCINAEAVADGKWFCKMYQLEIPEHVIKVGCEKHQEIR